MFTQMDKMKNLFRLLLLALLIGGFAACGGGNGEAEPEAATGQTDTPEACALLSDADVAAALGATEGAVSKVGDVAEGFSSCNWQRTDDALGNLSMYIWIDNNPDQMDWIDGMMTAQVDVENATAVSDIGSEAYLDNDNNSQSMVWQKENRVFIVMTLLGSPLPEAEFISLAQNVDQAID